MASQEPVSVLRTDLLSYWIRTRSIVCLYQKLAKNCALVYSGDNAVPSSPIDPAAVEPDPDPLFFAALLPRDASMRPVSCHLCMPLVLCCRVLPWHGAARGKRPSQTASDGSLCHCDNRLTRARIKPRALSRPSPSFVLDGLSAFAGARVSSNTLCPTAQILASACVVLAMLPTSPLAFGAGLSARAWSAKTHQERL
jgi:hypothetical protein